MAEQSFPFENIDTTEAQFSEWATNFQETGLQGSPDGTELTITVTGSDLNLTVAAGQAFIRGHYYINTSDLVLAVTSAGTNTRIDIVVVELDPEANTIVTKIVSGEAVAADPVAPTLTQSATGIYQLPISTLTIPASTVVITSGMLADTRTFMGNRIGIWTTATRPANPTAYQTLGYNTTIGSHESWNGTAWVGFFDPITTEGDLVVGDATGQASRLGIGADDQVLTVVGGAPAWADGAAAGFYYSITASGTYPVDLEAGLYNVQTVNSVTINGEVLSGAVGLKDFPSGITSLVTSGVNSYISRDFTPDMPAPVSVAYGNNVYVTMSQSPGVATSPDAITWTPRSLGDGEGENDKVRFGNGLFVLVGSGGRLRTSPDGITWTGRTSGFGAYGVRSAVYGGGLWVAVGENGLLSTSLDGITWTARTSGFGSTRIWEVGYGDGKWVAVGEVGKYAISSNGTSWSSGVVDGFGGFYQIYCVGHGNSTYVAGGAGGVISTSTNGTSWTQRSAGFGTRNVRGIIFAEGVFVAVSFGANLRTSPDGVTWTARNPGVYANFNDLTYGNDLFVVIGSGKKIQTSSSPFGEEVSYDPVVLSLEPKSPVTILS